MKINELLLQQYNFFNSNKTKDLAFRLAQLKKFKQLIKEYEDEFYTAIYTDFGKSEPETFLTELSQIHHELNMGIKHLKRWSKKKRVATNLSNLPAKSYIIPEPLGNTLVIGAWNYPYALSLIPMVSAMAAGNTVILKPSELPTHTAKVMAKMINTNFPAEYLYVQEGGVELTTELLTYKFDKIFFTGSIPVGKVVYEAAAKHLTPVTLELGGKSPAIVLADTNIKVSAKRLVWAKFLNAGQTCVAPDYILVDKAIEKDFLKAVKEEIDNYYQNEDGFRENYLQIINDKNRDRLEQLIDPSKVYCGGQVDKDYRLIAPTVMHNVSFDDKIMKDEIFGPILPVISFTALEDVIAQVKSQSKPLACYIYSNSKTKVKRLLREISFGGGAINDSVMHLTNPNLPFGGVGYSGMGNYHGEAGFRTFSHYKSILHKTSWLELPLKYYPYSAKKMKLVRRLFE